MPRLPTMRVIGSHAMSTRPSVPTVGVWVDIALPPLTLVAGEELLAGLAPLRLLVDGLVRDAPEPPDDGAVHAAGGRRHPPAGWLVHERHELVGEARHRAA